MSSNTRLNGSDSRGQRRRLRAERERERRLVLRHRWYAGGIATLLTGALVFTGVGPAMAGTETPAPTETTSQADPTPTSTAPAVDPDEPTPTPTVPAPEKTDLVDDDTNTPDNDSTKTDTTPTKPLARSLAADGPGGITPQLVPSPEPGGAVVNVNLRALRTGPNQTAPTAGVQLKLHTNIDTAAGGGNPAYSTYGAAVAQPWATCTTDTDGDCSFPIPPSGVGAGVRYWVVPVYPSGTNSFLSDYLVTGDNTDTGTSRFAVTPYAFRTPVILASATPYQLPGNGTTNMPTNSLVGNPTLPLSLNAPTANRWTHHQNSATADQNNMITTLNNPRYQPTCVPGLKVALIIDVSSSMSTGGNAGINGAKAASTAFVNQFVDKGVELGIYSFGTTAATVMNPTVVTSASVDGILDDIDDITIPANNYTNWDRGIGQIAGLGFDLAVVLTDGNPTRYGAPVDTPATTWTNLRKIEEAILSANLVKSQGTQLLTFGVGAFLQASMPQNLRSVTGPVQWPLGGVTIDQADFAITNDWPIVAAQLAILANRLTCDATVQVLKKEKAVNGTLTNAGGWVFTPNRTGQGTLSPAGAQTTVTSLDQNVAGRLPVPWTITFTDVNHTADLQIAETAKDGWAFESVTCVKNQSGELDIDQVPNFTLTGLKSGDAVVCTVVNSKIPDEASVKVSKSWVINGTTYAHADRPAGFDTTLTLTGPGALGATPQASGVAREGYIAGETVTINETAPTIPANCTLNSSLVTSVSPNAPLPYAPKLVAGENAYVITNTVTCTQQLTLRKVVVNDNGGTDTASQWTLTATPTTGPDITGPLAPAGTPDASYTGAAVAGVEYTLNEILRNGYDWTTLSCTGPHTGTTKDNPKLTLAFGEHVTCTFTNNDLAPTLTLVKAFNNADGSAGAVANFPLTAAGGGNTVINGQISGTPGATSIPVSAGIQYTLSEALATGWTQDGLWSCRTVSPGQAGPQDPVLGNTIMLGSGDAATCTVTNAPIPVNPVIEKSVTNVEHLTTGVWQVSYDITVTQPVSAEVNPLGLSSPYEVRDTLAFGGGITVTGVSVDGTPVNPVPPGEFVVGSGTVVPGTPVTYTLVVTATIADGVVGTDAADCTLQGGEGGKTGFLNTVALYRGNTVVDTDDACGTPTKPVIEKTATSSTYNAATNDWTVIYSVTVNNSAGANNVFYSLTDVPEFDADVKGTPVVTPGGGTPALSGGMPTWSGGTLTIVPTSAKANIAAGATHTYTVSFVVDVTGWSDDELAPCEDDGGFFNEALLTVDGDTSRDDACGEVSNHVNPKVEKNVTGLAQGANGSWTVTYDVTVTQPALGDANPQGLGAVYSLSDDLQFGGDLEIVSASWAGQAPVAGASGSWTAPNFGTPQTFAANVLIAAGVTHRYTVTVNVNVTTAAVEEETYVCGSEEGVPFGGFLNTATMTVRGVPETVNDCAEPVIPEVTKSGPASATLSPDGTWSLSYTIEVTNPSPEDGGLPVYFDLWEQWPTIPTGFSLDGDWTVVATNGGPAPVGDGTFAHSAASTLVVEDGVLPKDTTYVYEVTGTVEVSSLGDPADLDQCGTEAGVPGFVNGVELTSGKVTVDDDHCITVDLGEVEVEKSDGAVTQLANGTWQIDYDVTVTNTSDYDTVYTLTDTPDFGGGWSVVTEGWQGDDPPVANTFIEEGGEDVFTYRIIATLDDQWEGDLSLVCEPDEGGAFYNTVEVTYPGGSDDDNACAEPETPDVTKTNGTATFNASTGAYDLSYTVTVSNASDIQLAYTAYDVPLALPSNVNLTTSWAIAGPADANGGTFTAPATAWDGVTHTLIGTGTLLKNTSHVFTVTAGVTLTDAVDSDDLECGETPVPGEGFWNTASVTNGVGEGTDSECIEIIPPPVTVEKSDGAVKQLDDFTWQIDYTITVRNTAPAGTVYTLTDTPDLGAGWVEDSGVWVGTAPVANKPIAGAISPENPVEHLYKYRVIASLDDESEGDPSLECVPGEGGAFYNTVEVAYPGGSDDDDGCGEPASPTVDKTAGTPSWNGTNWVISYTVEVSNDNDVQVAYDLSDKPQALPVDLTLTTPWAISPPANLNGGTFAAASSTWNGVGNTDVGTGTLPAGASHVFTVTAGVVLKVGTPTAPATLRCGETSASNSGIWNLTEVTNGVGRDSDEDCTSVTASLVEVVKHDGTASQDINGLWTIRYQVDVTNVGQTPTTFTLTDTPQFDSSFTVQTQTWEGNPVLTNVPIDPGTANTKTYYYVVTATSAKTPADPTGLVCSEPNGGGFYNKASITFPGGADDDFGCATPGIPSVVKSAKPSTQNTTTGAWTISYDVVVTNSSGKTLAYTVTDTPETPLPADVTGGSWAATGPVIVGGGSGTVTGGWTGSDPTTQLAKGLIPNGATHTYTVSLTVNVAANVTAPTLTCPNGGIDNTATVTNGVGGNQSTACAQIVRPDVDVAKTVTSTSQLEDGTWQITYQVTATNVSATQAAVYSLTDTLEFGGDIVVLDGDDAPTWSGPTSGTFTGDTATLATNRVLVPRGAGEIGRDTYTVTVLATVDEDAREGDTLGCYPDSEDPSGGFLNTVLLTVNGTPKTADDCSEPELPTVSKTGTAAATQDPDDPDVWLVSYEITVEAGAFDTFYTLQDDPGFADGITVTTGKAQRDGTDDVIDIGPGDVFPNAPVALAANDTHTWTVSWLATIPAAIDADAAECGEVPVKGQGFYNEILLLQGEDVVDDGAACIPVEEWVYPTVTKTVTSTSQDSETGLWTIEYSLVVKLAEEGVDNPKGLATKYDLDDALLFGAGIDVQSATWQGPAPLTTTHDFDDETWTASIATNRPILAGGEHVYTVKVVADVLKAAWDDGTTTCYPDSEEPNGGFLNTAELTSGDQTSTADDCAEPAAPEVEKTATSAVQNSDGTWTLTYTVRVDYPATDQEPLPSPVAYTLTEAPAVPENVKLADDEVWEAAAADAGTPAPDQPTWDGTGTWTVTSGELVVDSESETLPVHTYTISAVVEVTGPPTEELDPCAEGDDSIPVWNSVQLTSGEYVSPPSEACLSVDWDDVGIVKTHELDGEVTTVKPGDTFDYVLTVTNYGTRAATDVRVTDADLNARLDIEDLQVSGGVSWSTPPGWTENSETQPNDVVDLVIASLAVGQSVEIRITVTFLAAEPGSVVVPPGGAAPEPATPVSTLKNLACVDMDRDQNGDNDCDTDEITTRDITGVVFTSCVSDAPLLGWVILKSESLRDEPIDAVWVPVHGTATTDPADRTFHQDGGSLVWAVTEQDDLERWPGTVFTPSGIAIDYPGWRPIQRSDIAGPNQYYFPGTSVVMTPEEQEVFVYNGLIVDPSELDGAWRLNTTITFTVNPTLEFEAVYPPATEACKQARHTEVQIEKTASVSKTDPGATFTYDLEVANVSDDSAAAGVVVTDAIPADLKITDVSWPGEGDATVFPNWDTCEVTGQNASGYGGTLECVLFGPLQPVGANAGASSAPTITLTAFVDPKSTSSVITNVAFVDYHTFGDPEDAGWDSDDAVVTLSALPATGGSPMLPLLVLAFLALVGGAATLVVRRRQRGEEQPTL